MSNDNTFDIAIIGGGSGGLSLAAGSAQPGLKIAGVAGLLILPCLYFGALSFAIAFLFCLLVLLTATIRLKQFYNAQHPNSTPITSKKTNRSWSHD